MPFDIKPISKGSAGDAKFKVDAPLPRSHFFILLSGARFSGKSVLCQNLLKAYEDEFQYIFILSPSVYKNDDYDAFDSPRYVSYQKIWKFDDVDKFGDIILDIIKQQDDVIKEQGRSKAASILMVLDDVLEGGSKLLGYHAKALNKLAYNGRHSKISVILCSQVFRMVSNGVRSNCTMSIMFSPNNLSEVQKYLEEYVVRSDKHKVEPEMMNVFNDPDNRFQFITLIGKDCADAYGLNRSQRLIVNFDMNHPLIQ